MKRRWQVGKCSFKDAKISDKLKASNMVGIIIVISIWKIKPRKYYYYTCYLRI